MMYIYQNIQTTLWKSIVLVFLKFNVIYFPANIEGENISLKNPI